MPVRTLENAQTALVEAVRARDPSAFSEWVQRNSRWVRGVVYAVLGDKDRVDDVVQQVWMAVWQRIETLNDPQRWKTWLYSIARHAALDAGRDTTRRRRGQAGGIVDEPPDPREVDPGRKLERRERHERVLQAIEALPPLYREPFVLRHLEGWSYRQIADVMDMPVDSVETRLVRAMRMMRQALASQGDDPT
ncbi:MAG: ECF RNA polymerase sigma-E factor [Phycisphaerae bacterium]|nr:ECF RNA polymerase sigma-E factor [Phycisphaerae bacterium]